MGKLMVKQFLIDLTPFNFLVSTDSPLVIQNLTKMYGDVILPAESKTADYHVQILKSAGLRAFVKRQARFLSDQQEPFKPLSHKQAFAFLEWGMNYSVAANEMQHIIVHSAVLAKNGKAILFPAPPGSGKSTLTSFLAFNGWQLLSDEMSLIVPNTSHVMPFVRPICLKNASIDIAQSWFPDADFSTIAPDTHKGDVIHLSPPAESWRLRNKAVEIVGIVFPNYDKNKELEIYQLNKTQAFTQLAENSFNYGVVGDIGFQTLTAIIDKVDSFDIHYNDLKDVKAFLEEDIIKE
jgi:HprK-related kinase A